MTPSCGEIWRALTCVFVHANLLHLLCNATGLAVFGNLAEATIGRAYVPLVFLVTALSGSVFSLFLSASPSVGASGGILGLAAFVFVNAGHSPILNSLGVWKMFATMLALTALGGIVAYDLFDSAAHLGGLLAGLGLGWAIRRPELVRRGRLRFACAVAWLLLVLGALGAIGLTIRPGPITRPQPTSTKLTPPPEAKTLNKLLSLALEPVTSSELPLVAQSLAEQDSAVAYVTAYGLSRLGQTAVPELTRSLSNAVPQARVWAACSLGMIGSDASDSAAALAMLLEDPDPHVRMAAGYALGRMKANPPGAAQAMVRGLALGASPVWKFWVSTEHEEEPGARVCILRGEQRWMPLALAGGSGTVEGIVTDPANQPSWSGFFVNVRPAAERYAWEILPQATDLEPLLNALADPINGEQAAIALSRGGRFAVKGLVAALHNPEASVRERAAVALGWIGAEALEAVPELVAMLQDEPLAENGHCRPCAAAVYALAHMGDGGFAALKALGENDPGNAGRYARVHLRLSGRDKIAAGDQGRSGQ
jgi:rhomboid protease GluP